MEQIRKSAESRRPFPGIPTGVRGQPSPHRHLRKESAIALGVGKSFTSIPLLSEKPIVRSHPPADFNKCLLAKIASAANKSRLIGAQRNSTEGLPSIARDDLIETLAKKRIYTSTTRELTEEAALPTLKVNAPKTTIEPDADQVRCHRTVRYASHPAVWQVYGRQWEELQLRKFADTQNELRSERSKMHNQQVQDKQESKDEKIEPKGTKFPRHMPGYGGFVPRHVVEPHSQPEVDCVSDRMCSTTRRTYRRFPSYEYKLLDFAHKGPLSKTVTLTHPFNPFNKVEHHAHIYRKPLQL